MLVLLDSNIYFSALISPHSFSARIIRHWQAGRFTMLTCQEQIDEIRAASRNPKFHSLFRPHQVGTLLNYLYAATVWPEPIPRRHQAADPTDSYLLNLMEDAQPDYAVTGDKRSGLLQLGVMGRTKVLTAESFCADTLRA